MDQDDPVAIRPLQHPAASLEYRAFAPGERSDLSRFFREAGYPVPISPDDQGWGAWSQGTLVGAIALCHEENEWLLRGPEILHAFRRRRVGAELLKLAIPKLRSHTCYCVAYSFLARMYSAEGFKPCPSEEIPKFLARRIKGLREAQWDVTVLRRALS
jgi:predicted N-acetyltransferase YhbS